MLWQFIVEGIINANNWFAIVCFYSCFIVLIFAMNEIKFCTIDNHIVVKRLKYKIFLLLENNREQLCLFQDYCTIERKKSIIQELALIKMFCGEKYDENFCSQKFESDAKDYFVKLLEKAKFENKRIYRTRVKSFFETRELPRHFYLFRNYYTGEILKSKKSIGGILMATFSIIIGILSLFSLNAFLLLSFRFWIILISGFLIEIFDTMLHWKLNLLNYIELLSNDYDKLKKDFDNFLINKQHSTVNAEGGS